MGRLPSFVAGLIVGGALAVGSLKFHVVRAYDGFHLVPKLTAQFSDAYIDIRSFGVSDWDEHPLLAMAIVRADKAYLMNNAASQSLRNAMDGFFETLGGSRP